MDLPELLRTIGGMFEDYKTTDYIAIYAGIISTLGLIWSIIKWCKQRGILKVKAAICRDRGTYTEAVEPKQWGELLRVEVVNSGKANITISQIGLKTSRPNSLYFWQALPNVRFTPSGRQPPLPFTLEPTKTECWLMDNVDALLSFRTVKTFFVMDSHGKEWRVSKSQIRRMRKVIKFEKQQKNADK